MVTSRRKPGRRGRPDGSAKPIFSRSPSATTRHRHALREGVAENWASRDLALRGTAGLIVLPGDSRRELDPAAASVEAPQHELETLAIDAFGWIHSAHVLQQEAARRSQDRLQPVMLFVGFHEVVHRPDVCCKCRQQAASALCSENISFANINGGRTSQSRRMKSPNMQSCS